ncbi:MAG: hypothetical protein KDJ38_20140 [Gammaproteobacteria bacterium]|nr:hypothetical protein [Gammaproteobacteria bacterium]
MNKEITQQADINNKPVVLSQGIAGTVLASELTGQGYQALNYGQLFISRRLPVIKGYH